jgi:hypothetical protein
MPIHFSQKMEAARSSEKSLSYHFRAVTPCSGELRDQQLYQCILPHHYAASQSRKPRVTFHNIYNLCNTRLVSTRAVCKIRGLVSLLLVGSLWRCGDGLFFEVLPLASGELLTTLHPLLKNVLQTVDHFEISCFRAPFSWFEKPRNRRGRDLN